MGCDRHGARHALGLSCGLVRPRADFAAPRSTCKYSLGSADPDRPQSQAPNLSAYRRYDDAIRHNAESEIDIRKVFGAVDFGAKFTPSLRKQEEYLRAQMAELQ